MEHPTYLCIDLKSYYASVECVDRGLDPLTANLIVADESRTDKTICLAVSPALKALGLPGRPRLWEAREKVRIAEAARHEKIDYIVAVPRMARYIEVSSRIYEIYLRYAAQEDIHVYSIDECFIDLTPYLRFYRQAASPAHAMALTIIRDVIGNTGITATAGIGSNMYLAKIAMDIVAKKAPPDADGVRIAELDEDSYKRLLWDHKPMTDFWQIGNGTVKRLARYGMFTMGDVAQMSLTNEDLLYRIFGVNAELLIDHAWGIEPCRMEDIKHYSPSSNSLAAGQVLPRPYKFDEARLIFAEMADTLLMDLSRKGLASDHFSYSVGFDVESLEKTDYAGPVVLDYYGRLSPKPAGGTVRLPVRLSGAEAAAEALLKDFDRRVDHSLLVRRLCITADEVRPDNGAVQLDFMTDYAALAREKQLRRALLGIRSKHGANAVFKGMNLLESGTALARNAQIGGHRA